MIDKLRQIILYVLTHQEPRRFLLVGITTVLIDLITYRGLLFAGLAIPLAKAIGFSTGTVFAWFANRLWTFDRAQGGTNRFMRFLAVYAVTLLVNIAVNSIILGLLPVHELSILFAFVVATGLSAMLNFIGMKFLVFRPSEPDS